MASAPDDPAVNNPPAHGYYFVNEDQSIWASAGWTDSEYSKFSEMEDGIKVGWFRPAGAELTVTGQRLDEEAPSLGRFSMLLSDPLEACGKGECGACTVLLDGKAIASCITPALKALDKSVVTIEGLGQPGKLHPLQEAFIDRGAVQCGFCTPGMILVAKELLEREKKPSREKIQEAISGNMCRCTGYVKIDEAIEAVARGEGVVES